MTNKRPSYVAGLSLLVLFTNLLFTNLAFGEGELQVTESDQPVPDSPKILKLQDGQVPCQDPLKEGWFQPINQVEATLDKKEEDESYPLDCATTLFSSDPSSATAVLGPYPPSPFMWAASQLYHQPLYFDDTTLERYGQTISPLAQPLWSAAQFYATFPIIPYKLGLDHPYEPVSALGYYRPGSPTPPMRKHLPLQLDAATLEGAAWVGAIFLLP